MKQILFLLLMFCFVQTAFAQQYDPVDWAFDSKQISDTEYDLIYKAKIDKGWYVYSQYLASDEGPVATSVNYEGEKAFKTSGKSTEAGEKKAGYDAMFDMDVVKFKGDYTITQRIKVTDASKPVTGYLTFMTCNDKMCLPPTDVDFTIKLPSGTVKPPVEKSVAEAPQTTTTTTPAVETPKVVQPAVDAAKIAADKAAQQKAAVEALAKEQAEKAAAEKVAVQKQIDEEYAKRKAEQEEALAKQQEQVRQQTDKMKAAEAKAKAQAEKAKAKTEAAQKSAEEKKKEIEKAIDNADNDKKVGLENLSNLKNLEKLKDLDKLKDIPENLDDVSDLSSTFNINGDADANGGLQNPVKWTIGSRKISNREYELVYTGAVDKGWYVYSQFIEGEDGPVPTSINYEGEKAFKLIGKGVETGSEKSGYDAVFGMDVTKFKETYTITQKIYTDNPEAPISGYLTFMTCDDSMCLPPEDIDFKIIPADQKMIAFTANNNIEKAVAGNYKTPVSDCIEKKELGGLLTIFLLGMIGGAVALLTPCVFPMIPLTVSYFTKGNVSKAKGITNAIIYGLSIIVIYVTLGTVLTLAFGPQIMNAISTSMFLNLLFFVLFVAFAFAFFGYYEITLPSSWGNATDRMADKGGLVGIFFMAFTLGIVSFSCTGPIVGTLLVESFNGTGPSLFGGRLPLAPPAGMLGFALALALPFTLFAAFPAWLKSLPKSGGWMTTVKVVLGFLELALALKFLSLVDLTQHWGILKYEVFMGLWILIFGLMGLYLFGAFRFPHDAPKGTALSLGRRLFGLASLLFAGYLCLGLTTDKQLGTYKALPVMSGLAPSTQYAIFKDDESTCPLKLDCFKDYEEGLAYAKEMKKPIMLDFTGYGCVNCRKMEEHVWPREGILEKLKEDYVLISLYVDDKTKLSEPYISDFDGKKKRNIGNKWADFQAKNFDNNSQPYYVLLSHDGQQLLTNPTGYPTEGSNTNKAKFFNKFLECGLNAFYGKVCKECKPQEENSDKKLGMND